MLDMTDIKEDVWIPTQCGRCYGQCGIRVRRVNGVAVKIEGVPETTLGSEGGLCGKGAAGLQVLYDPNRLNKPLKRTNPEKGLNVDPKWKEISWEEALNEIVEKLKKIRRISFFPLSPLSLHPKASPRDGPAGEGSIAATAPTKIRE